MPTFTAVVVGAGLAVFRIEGNLLSKQYQKRLKGMKFYMTIFRNPEGKPEKKDEFLALTDFGLFPFSVLD